MHSSVEGKASKEAPHHTASTCINGLIVLDCYINSLSSPTNNYFVGRSRIHNWRSVGEATLSESPSEIPRSQCQYIMRFPITIKYLSVAGGVRCCVASCSCYN